MVFVIRGKIKKHVDLISICKCTLILNTPTGMVTVTIFDDILSKIVTIDAAVLMTEMEEVIMSMMFTLPPVEVSSKNNLKIVTDLKVGDDY